MTWVKLDDRWPSNRKLRAVDPLDRLMWLTAIAYCSEQNTDGYLDPPMTEYVAFLAGQADAASAAARLVAAGLLDPDQHGYRIHDYLDYQPSAAQRVELSNLKADAGRKGGRPKGKHGAKQTESTVLSACVADGKQNESKSKAVPVPVLIPPPSSSSPGARQTADRADPAPTNPMTDDDERIDQALHHLGQADQTAAIAAGTPIRNRSGHLAACIARRAVDRPALAKLAAEHPDWPAEQLARHHLAPPPPPRRCNQCRQPEHPGGLADCPELDHLRTRVPPPADLRAGLTKAANA